MHILHLNQRNQILFQYLRDKKKKKKKDGDSEKGAGGENSPISPPLDPRLHSSYTRGSYLLPSLLFMGPFLESPETSWPHFGWHNSLCIFETKASRSTKLCIYFNFCSFYNIWKDQLYRISGLEFYAGLSGRQSFRDFRETGPSFCNLPQTFIKVNS